MRLLHPPPAVADRPRLRPDMAEGRTRRLHPASMHHHCPPGADLPQQERTTTHRKRWPQCRHDEGLPVGPTSLADHMGPAQA